MERGPGEENVDLLKMANNDHNGNDQGAVTAPGDKDVGEPGAGDMDEFDGQAGTAA